MSKTYTATIGLEVHAELKTKSKMFCGCKNDPHDGEPNTHICPICLAHPGTLPVPNEEAIAMVLLLGGAVNAEIATYSEFDRKNYFYPDIPKAYQISQYAYPFLKGGTLRGVALTRVHLEEDTARSQHEQEGVSLVDFNRSGVPLMELVTEPVIHDAKTAVEFARELQLVLRTLDISDAQMERGEMRVEANISVSSTSAFGTKVEVKNLNSFRSVESAIDFEIKRQVALLDSGGRVSQETRGWDEVRLVTFTQRSKETAKDYRYFPDPDLPKMYMTTHEYFSKTRLDEIMPELPDKKREKYKYLGLTEIQIELLISQKEISGFYELVLVIDDKNNNPEVLKLAANYLLSDVLSLVQQGKSLRMAPADFLALMEMVSSGEVSSRVAKDLLIEFIETTCDPVATVKERGLEQSSDPSALQPLVDEIIKENNDVVLQYRQGKLSALQFLVGQGMKKSRGTANPGLLADLIRVALE